MMIYDSSLQVTICINAPLHFRNDGKTKLIFFALPNGNSIEWTQGKKLNEGDDWHFDIQHIAAQTRFIRQLDKRNNYVLIYLMANNKSWPLWKRNTPNALASIKKIVDGLVDRFEEREPGIVLSAHSGGGSFIFGYIDSSNEIPVRVERILFIDANYGYIDSLHRQKFTQWLSKSKTQLVVMAYNDSVVIYNGKPLVSPTGGTWYRSKLMYSSLAAQFNFRTFTDTSFINHITKDGRIRIHLKLNPLGLIYHTVQVEKNGFIYGVLSNTKFDRRKYFSYFGTRAYNDHIR